MIVYVVEVERETDYGTAYWELVEIFEKFEDASNLQDHLQEDGVAVRVTFWSVK